MIDGTARRRHFLEIGSLSGRKEQGCEIKRRERVTICRKNRPVDGAERDLVTEIDDLLLPGTSRIQDFRDSPRRLSCASKPSCACLHAPAYTYNNVTHIPRVRLFLLFRPVARGACSIARGWFRQPERDMPDRGDKWDESQGCGTRAITSLDSLRKRFVKPKSRKLYRLISTTRTAFSLYFIRDNDTEILSKEILPGLPLFFLFRILFPHFPLFFFYS